MTNQIRTFTKENMKTANTIWLEFSAGKLTTEQAFDEIGKSLRSCGEKETPKLLKLSDKILDKEVPMEERNLSVEQDFWAMTHKEPEE